MPPGTRLSHPAGFLATGGGVGLLRPAPGTWGSLLALPLAAVIVWSAGEIGLLVAAAIATGAGTWAAAYVGRGGDHDAGIIVIDEIAGQWLCLVPVAYDFGLYVVAFALFRLFDIAKPWPASWVDRRLKTPFGVMLDDVVAGLYGAVAVWAVSLWIGFDPWLVDRVSLFH